MKDVLLRMFSSTGDLSSGRIGHYIGLITVVVLTTYDTFSNGRLDFALAGLLLSAGTIGYNITKTNSNAANVTNTGVKNDIQ